VEGRFADVKSLDALDRLALAMRQFHSETTIAMDEVEMEIQRAVEWIQHDCKQYWNDQVRRAYQQVTEARVALERKQMFRVADRRPSCYDEKKALEKAKRRLALAQEKVEAVRRWSWAISQAMTEYKSEVSPLGHWLESDLPRAIALVHRLSGSLESYVGMNGAETERPADAPPEDEPQPPAASVDGPDEPEATDPPRASPATRSPDDEDVEPDDGRNPAGIGIRRPSERETGGGRAME